jgi:hypothetical protein
MQQGCLSSRGRIGPAAGKNVDAPDNLNVQLGAICDQADGRTLRALRLSDFAARQVPPSG